MTTTMERATNNFLECRANVLSTRLGLRPGTGLATGKRKRGLLSISLVSLLFILADRMAEPVLEQYVYQVYTQQVYGNRSVKVLVTKTPCLNTSNTSTALADDLRDQVKDFLPLSALD